MGNSHPKQKEKEHRKSPEADSSEQQQSHKDKHEKHEKKQPKQSKSPEKKEKAMPKTKHDDKIVPPDPKTVAIERKIFDLVDGQIRSQCLYIMCKHSIPDILFANEGKPVSAKTLAEEIEGDIDEVRLSQVMRYMAIHGICDETVTGDGVAFRANEVTQALTKTHHTSLNFWALDYPLFAPAIMNAWKAVEKKVESDSVFEDINGLDIFSFMKQKDTQSGQLFGRDMESLSVTPEQCCAYFAPELRAENEAGKTLVHIGGNTGDMIRLVKERCPNLRCIDFDTPEAIEETAPVEGVEKVAGDIFDSESLPKADVMFMRFVLYDYSDEKCIEILKNCASAIPQDGRIIAIEPYYPDPGQTTKDDTSAFFADVFVMVMRGRKERSKSDWNDLFKEAGLEIQKKRLIDSSGFNPVSILLCAKKIQQAGQ